VPYLAFGEVKERQGFTWQRPKEKGDDEEEGLIWTGAVKVPLSTTVEGGTEFNAVGTGKWAGRLFRLSDDQQVYQKEPRTESGV